MVLIFPYATKHYEKNEKNSLSQIYTMIHISSSLKETWRKIELSEIKNYNRRATVVNWKKFSYTNTFPQYLLPLFCRIIKCSITVDKKWVYELKIPTVKSYSYWNSNVENSCILCRLIPVQRNPFHKRQLSTSIIPVQIVY